EEIQWDWLELPEAPWGGKAHLLQATLSHSTKFRGALAESEDQPHLAEAMDRVLRLLGGTARRWRIDRMSTAVDVKTGDLLPWFAALARHWSPAPASPRQRGPASDPGARAAAVRRGGCADRAQQHR